MSETSTPSASSISSVTDTLQKIRSINRREAYLHSRLTALDQRSNSPSAKIVEKLAKAARILLRGTELLSQDNRRLFVTNDDLSHKRARNVKQLTKRVTTKQAITVAEGREISHQLRQEDEARAEASAAASQAPPRRCTLCRQPRHTKRRCSAVLESI